MSETTNERLNRHLVAFGKICEDLVDTNDRLRADLAQRTSERDEARENLDRTQRVLAKIDAVRVHQSDKLVRVYEASGAEPQHFNCIDKFVGVMRVALDAIEPMGYEWRWTKSIDENGEQVGAWVRRDAKEVEP